MIFPFYTAANCFQNRLLKEEKFTGLTYKMATMGNNLERNYTIRKLSNDRTQTTNNFMHYSYNHKSTQVNSFGTAIK